MASVARKQQWVHLLTLGMVTVGYTQLKYVNNTEGSEQY